MSNKLRVCTYVQTNDLQNLSSFGQMINIVKNNKVDLLVFPENCYNPFFEKDKYDMNIDDDDCFDKIVNSCLKISKKCNAAVIVGFEDNYGVVFNVFANANALNDESDIAVYIKHTMTGTSAFCYDDYDENIMHNFPIIKLKNFELGMIICYDCNHAAFSAMYGQYGIDAIINSTGGDVVRDKWYKYNKARAIENQCFNIVTMGGSKEGYCGALGFNRRGGELECEKLGHGLFLYEIDKEANCQPTDDENCYPTETVNKYQDIYIPENVYSDYIKRGKAEKIKDGLYVAPHKYERNGTEINANIVFIVAEGDDIAYPEYILPKLYDISLNKYHNKRYIIINKFDDMTEEGFKKYISVILKVRAMENYCAVILESNIGNKCYQTSINRATQVVASQNKLYGIDLNRTTGPEAIWKTKTGMHASWRTGYETLIKDIEDSPSASQED